MVQRCCKLLRTNGYRKPKINIPAWITPVLAKFNEELKFSLPFIEGSEVLNMLPMQKISLVGIRDQQRILY